MPENLLDDVHGAWADVEHVVLRSEQRRKLFRLVALVESRILEADRCRDQPLRHVPGHAFRDRAGVDASREENSQGHLALEANANGLIEGAVELVLELLNGTRLRFEREIPVLTDLDVPAGGLEHVTGG